MSRLLCNPAYPNLKGSVALRPSLSGSATLHGGFTTLRGEGLPLNSRVSF